MKISVIIPTYKPQSYIWECLDSICSQTFSKDNFEVILVLNGCKEPYDDQIREYMSNHPDVQWNFIQTDEGGVSNARNIGLDAARGEYVAFIDDDDYISPSYLEELISVSAPDTIGLTNTLAFTDGKEGFERFEISQEFVDKHKNGKQKFYIPKKLFAGPCMKLIHRSIIGDRRFNGAFKNSEDSLFMFEISDRVKWADFTSSEAIYYRRFREGSAVTTKRTLCQKFSNSFKIIWVETKLFFGGIPHYNLCFYITRMLGAIRSALLD